MKPGIYRNRGAGWMRSDGTRVERGDEFVPTEEELRRRAYKLRYVGPADEFAHEPPYAPPNGGNVEDYSLGGGWYMVGGVKVQGRERAEELLHGQD